MTNETPDESRRPELQELAMPSAKALSGRVARHLSEAVLAPLAIFYVVDAIFGLWPALGASAAWTIGAITVYLLRGGRPSALLVASAGLAMLQLAVTAAAREPKVFFLQPTIATYIFGCVMLGTSWRSSPMILRLALDFVPLPSDVVAETAIQRFFRRLSVLWGLVLLINASITLLMLIIASTRLAVPVATAASAPIFMLGLALSYRGFKRAIHAAGYVLVWGGGEATT